jgi:hypothetical protein
MSQRETPDSLAVFLRVVEHDRDERCRRVMDEAEGRARELVRTARRDARRRVTDAARDDRERVRRRVDAARAELGTRARRSKYEVESTLLERGLERLDAELRRRFGDPVARLDWMLAVVRRAGEVLQTGPWNVTLPLETPQDEIVRVTSAVRAASGSDPKLHRSGEIDTGMVIEFRGGRLDGTIEGLLAQPLAVGARLLLELLP